jgi:Putative Flp pilus-assembly TadE/G-like
MNMTTFSRRTKLRDEEGQAMLFTLLVLGLFLIGAMAFAIDLSNTWFSRQSAQTAADAACTAGVMDMLVLATDGTMPTGSNFTSGTAFDCFSTSTAAPCSYAALNGFGSTINQSSANSGTLGTNVYVDFPAPSSVNLSSLAIPDPSVAASALMRVRVTRNNSTWFGAMLGTTKQGSGASAICAVINATSPIPILVLHPTKSGSLLMNGGGSTSSTGCGSTPCGDIVIAGGPAKSIQVNSSDPSAINFSGGPTIDLCAGGSNYCGSGLGVWGAVPNPGSSNFWTSSATCSVQNAGLCSGSQNPPQWNQSPPISDPLATQQAPGVPNFAGATISSSTGTTVGYHVNGCPDTRGCQEFTPGNYTNGICVGSPCGAATNTAIFDPGVYYLAGQACAVGSGSLCERSGSCIRPSTAKGDGSGGTIFYFSDAHSITVAGGGGSCNPPTGQSIDAFQITTGPTTSSGTNYLPNGVKCTASSVVPTNLTTAGSLTGSVLLAPCNVPDSTTSLCSPNCSVNFGDPLGAADPNGVQRGILFFQNRSVNAGSNPSWGGNGGMLLAGTMYFHQCVSGGSDTGIGCTGTVWNDQLTLGGSSGSNTYVLGDIIVDQLHVGGNGQIVMDLNPSAAFTTLKAALVQ